MREKLLSATVMILFAAPFLSAAQEGKTQSLEEENWRVALASPENPRIQHLAWPKLIATQDGTLVLACSGGIGHNRGGSGLVVSTSGDKGKSFSPPHILCYYPDDDARYADCGNVALGLAPDGAVILLAMAFRGDEANTILGWRSADNGRTWQRTDTSNLAENKTGSVYGHVLSVPGKGLVIFGHYRNPSAPSTGIWMSTSTDGGKSWGTPKSITERKYFEPAVTFTQGRFVGLFRLPGKESRRYDQAISDDLGKTWKISPAPIAIPKDLPGTQPSPFITVSPTNPSRLLALQSIRGKKDATQGRVYFWSADARKLDWQRHDCIIEVAAKTKHLHDWSYPWMIPLTDDEWLVAFYAGAASATSSIYTVTAALP